ncbi:SPJ_0845 family protein [Lactobacillus kalixensis]|nr:SPJ_0845 family protein [Lactobacillus kalixensis]
MGLTFDNPNNLNKMLDKFAVVPDPKKSPMNKRKKEEKDSIKEKENKDK